MYEIFGLELNLGCYIILFVVCQFINVALNTAKTIIMHKEEKISSSIINAITYGFYAIIVVMTASALPLWITIVISALTNLIGVYGSMWLLERFKRDSMWEIHATIDERYASYLYDEFDTAEIDYVSLNTSNENKYMLIIFSHDQKESTLIKERLDFYGAKYNVCEERVKL